MGRGKSEPASDFARSHTASLGVTRRDGRERAPSHPPVSKVSKVVVERAPSHPPVASQLEYPIESISNPNGFDWVLRVLGLGSIGCLGFRV